MCSQVRRHRAVDDVRARGGHLHGPHGFRLHGAVRRGAREETRALQSREARAQLPARLGPHEAGASSPRLPIAEAALKLHSGARRGPEWTGRETCRSSARESDGEQNHQSSFMNIPMELLCTNVLYIVPSVRPATGEECGCQRAAGDVAHLQVLEARRARQPESRAPPSAQVPAGHPDVRTYCRSAWPEFTSG